ncbi:MAG: Imm1 family immunity protein [Rhodomicrobium sp.]
MRGITSGRTAGLFNGDEGFVAEGYVRWKDLRGVYAGSLAALDEWIDTLQRDAELEQPMAVEVEREDGKVLYIGLGYNEAVLSFAASINPPHYVAISGRTGRGSEENVDFYFYGIWNEVPRRFLVPMMHARTALRLFWETGERSNVVSWEKI